MEAIFHLFYDSLKNISECLNEISLVMLNGSYKLPSMPPDTAHKRRYNKSEIITLLLTITECKFPIKLEALNLLHR